MDKAGQENRKKVGLIVNPIAGIGGRVGLKGSDGAETVRKALDLGAVRRSPTRAIEMLKEFSPIKDEIDLFTCPLEMGEDEAKACAFAPVVLGSNTSGETTASDTRKAAREMVKLGVDLLLFVGGDGTARDIYEAVGDGLPVLGIPAGVKIHSSVYAVNPRRAAELVVQFLRGRAPLREMEVMDIDEHQFRKGRVSARLYGYLRIPFEQRLVQGAKAGSSSRGEPAKAIAEHIVDHMSDEAYYILGPGTTVKAIGDELGIDKTLLGVDVVYRRALVGKDLNEEQLLATVTGKKAKIIVTVIGGQGYIFGRGNQQISPQLIKEVGKDNIVVVSTQRKLVSLNGPLLVDTGDEALDRTLAGHVRVITGYNEESVWKVES
jgi:predicted polyphosphate/ATP-dependent NAD kinase